MKPVWRLLIILLSLILGVFFLKTGISDYLIVKKAEQIGDDIGLGGLVISISYVINFSLSLIMFLIGIVQGFILVKKRKK